MEERGVFNHQDLAKQQILFSGFYLPNTKITPTDSDAEIEYHGKAWIKIEVKAKGTELPKGQRILLETFCKDMKRAGKRCLVMVVEHKVFDAEKPILLKETSIRQLMEEGYMRWLKPHIPLNTYEFVLRFIRNVDIGENAFSRI